MGTITSRRNYDQEKPSESLPQKKSEPAKTENRETEFFGDSQEISEGHRLRILAVKILKAKRWCDGQPNPYHVPEFGSTANSSGELWKQEMRLVDTVVHLLRVKLIPEPDGVLVISGVGRAGERLGSGVDRAAGSGSRSRSMPIYLSIPRNA